MTPQDVSILVCTFGDLGWVDAAHTGAIPSAERQGALEVIAHHESSGPSTEHELLALSRNRAAAEASGDWLCFLDADDELAPGYLDAMRDMMRRYNLHRPGDLRDNPLLLVPAVQYIRRRYDSALIEAPPATLFDGRPLDQINCAVIGTLVPRRLFLELGGFRDRLASGQAMTALEDWDLWLRCTRAGAHLEQVPAAVYRVWLRDGSRNSDQSLYGAIRDEHLVALREGT